MTFSIRAALDSLVTLQAALTITLPISETIKKAYKTFPKQDGVPETPCFINVPSLTRMGHVASSRMQTWQIRSQLLVHDSDRNQAADITLAYLQKYLDALSAAITLNGNPVVLTDTTTNELGARDYGERSFTGIDVTITVQVPLEAVTVEA